MLSRTKIQALLLAGILALAGAAFGATGTDAQMQAAVSKQLQKSEFKNVRATVDNGTVTLQGTVDTYRQKLDAEKRVRKQNHVKGVIDQITVAGITVPDTELRNRLAKSLRYDRYGYGSVFNVLAVGVKHGVVTVSGEVRTPVDRESALALVQSTPGVKGVVDQVKVAPNSTFDDEVRIRTARAIYGDSVLSKYSLDPAVPIRILVDNGHVGLYGTVDSNMDRQIAYMRANQVFGAFSVENHLTTDQGIAR